MDRQQWGVPTNTLQNNEARSASLQQDVQALVEAEKSTWFFKSIWNAARDIWGSIWNTYTKYTDKDITDASAYAQLQNIIRERENKQFEIATKDLSEEWRRIEFDNINSYYYEKEGQLLNKAIAGGTAEEKYRNLSRINNSLYSWTLSDKQRIFAQQDEAIDRRLKQQTTEAFNNFSDGWLISNRLDNTRKSLQQSLAAETAAFKRGQLQFLAELEKSNATEEQKDEVANMFNDALSLRDMMNWYALEWVMQWLVWSDLTNYVTNKLGPANTAYAVELENKLFNRAESIKSTALINNWNIFRWLVWKVWVGTYTAAQWIKSVLNVWNTAEERFAKDFSEIELSDKSGLHYAFHWTLDNSDDIFSQLSAGIATWGISILWRRMTTNAITKATRLEDLLQNTPTWKRIMENKVINGRYGLSNITDELTASIFVNPAFNTAMKDVNTQERMIADAMIDLALLPIIQPIFDKIGAWFGRVATLARESSIGGTFALNDAQLINELNAMWLKPDEASNVLRSIQNYLKLTNNNSSNRDVLSFAKTNIARLREEWMLVDNGSVYILNQYQAKAVNPLNISVEEYLPIIEQWGSISLREDSIEAIDLDNIFKKINTTPVYSSPEKTITALISSSGWLNTSDVRAFVNNKDNKKLIDTLYKTLVSAKDKASKARKLESINAKTSPLQEIKDMGSALEIVLNNLRKPQDIITVYAPFQDPYGKTRFESKQIRASNVSIENYQFISNETGEDTQVFLQWTFYDTIADGSFWLSEVTYKFLRSGELSPGILDKPENSGMLDLIIDELHKVFGNTNIQRDGTWDINILKKQDGWYKLSFGNRQTLNGIIDPLKKVSIDYKWKNVKIPLDEDTVRLWKINDLLFFRVMAHPSNQSTEGMADIINGEIINLKNDILLGSIDANYSRASINQTLSIAKWNVRETVRGMFTDAEFKEFNKVLDESLFTNFATSKLAHLTDVASWDRSIALGNILEWVWLRAAERFKAIRSSIYKVKQSDLPTTNKKEIISGLLLWREPINLFKYMNVGNKWPTKAQQKALGIKAYDPIFKVSKEQTNTFIENIIAHKEKFREYSFDEKESMRTLYREKFNWYANAATEAYSHQVLRNSLNDLSYSNKIEWLKTTVWNKEFDSTFIERMNTAITEEDSIGWAILKVNEIMETVPDTVPKAVKNQLLKIKDFLDAKRIETLQNTPMYLDKMIERVNTISKIYADTAQSRFEWAGVYSEASQTSWGDNIINKSLNKLFDPYTKAQIYNEDVAKSINQYINTMILEPAGHTWDTLFELQQLKDRGLIDTEEYSNRRLAILNIIKDIIYPTANIDSFDISNELTKKIQDRDTILFGMINHIKDTISQSSIAIIKDDKTIVKWAEAAEIIAKDMSPWDLIKNFDIQIRKWYVDGYKIDASETLTPAYVIDTLEETRTIFNHIHNAGSPKRYKPIIVNGGSKWNMKWGTRDEYKYANNIYQYVMARYKGNFETKKHTNWFSEKIVPPILLDELKIYLDEIKDIGTTIEWVQKVLYRMLNKDETPIPGYINNLNIGDKDTLGIFSPEYLSSETDWVKRITDYFRANDKRFQEDFIKELGVSKEDWSKLAYKDVAKRLSAIVSNEQTMVPWLEVPVRNFVIEDIPSGTYHIKKDSITDIDWKPFTDISEIVWDSNIVPDTPIKVWGVETTFRRYLLDRLGKELDWFDENFSLEHFDNSSISDSIINYLNTSYTDGASYLHPDQVKFMSKFVSYIWRRRLANWKMDHNASTSIKFHHYKQDEWQSYLFKTLWNPYSKDMLNTINKFYPNKNSRLVWSDSTKLKNYWDKFVHFVVKNKKWYTDWMGKPIDISKLDKSRYEIVKEIPIIKEAWIERRLKWYLDSNTKHDRVASTSSSVESQTNEFTKQWDVRIHPVASTMIANNKIRIIKKDLKALEDFLANEGIPTANLFDKADEWTTFTLNQAGLDDTILPHTERYIKDEIQKIKNKITSPRFDNAGFQWRGLPRMEYKPTTNSKEVPIPDDVILVHKDRFEEIKEHLIYVDNEYYAVSYRNPVPNAENITLNKVKIDYSMEALDSIAFSPFNINVNKQWDFDGDAFNIMYVNKDHPEFISWLASAFGAVLSIEEARGNIPSDLIAKVYSDADPMEYRQEIYDYIVKHIKENKNIRQVRVPVQQAAKPVSPEKLRLEEIKNEISNIKMWININEVQRKPSWQTGVYELFPWVYANKEQASAIDAMNDFISQWNKDNSFVLVWRWGTWKTTIVNKALDNLPAGTRVVVSAPTNKALKVIKDSFPEWWLPGGQEIKFMTNAKLTGKVFKNNKWQYVDELSKFWDFPDNTVYIFDEASMMPKKDIAEIQWRTKNSRKIYMWDNVQLPPIEDGETLSKVFTSWYDWAVLKQRMRQWEDSPILWVTDLYAANIENKDVVMNPVDSKARKNKIISKNEDWRLEEWVEFSSLDKQMQNILNDFKDAIQEWNTDKVKLISYTNSYREKINSNVRAFLYWDEWAKNEFIEWEFLNIRKSNIPELSVWQDVIIDEVWLPIEESITTFTWISKLDTIELTFRWEETSNIQVLTKKWVKQAQAIRKQATEYVLKNGWFVDRSLAKRWWGIINKLDAFLEVDYWYAITSHTSQGSTYQKVYVAEDDILSVKPSSNEDKNKSLYVATSRPKKALVMLQPKSIPKEVLLEWKEKASPLNINLLNIIDDASITPKESKVLSDEELIQDSRVIELIKEQKKIEKEIDDADTLVRAIQNSITGKDAIATVDSFIRTADIIRKYAQEWKYASLGYTGTTPQEVEAKFREDITNAVTKYTKNLNEYNTTVLESPDVASNIAALGKVPESIQNAITDAEQLSNEIVDAIIAEFPRMLDNPDYKGIVAWFEQMTLDLAKTGVDKLPDGWENTIVKQILTRFEGIGEDKQKWVIKTLQAISASTNQVYEKLWKFDVLNYYDPLEQWEIVAIWDHRRIAETLKEGILRIRDAYKPISQLEFDRRYFWLQNQEVLKDVISQWLGSRVSNSRADTMYSAIDNLDNIKWRKDSRGEYTTIPGVYWLEWDPNNIPKWRDKPKSIYPQWVSFFKTRFQMIDWKRAYLNWNDKWVKWVDVKEINGIKVYKDKIESIKLELLQKHNANPSPNIYLTSKMSVTPDNIVPILVNGYSINKPIWADGKFDNKKLPNGLYSTTISHKYKEEFIRKVLPQMGIQYNSMNWKLINAIRLTQNMKMDNSLLTPEENLDKGLWSIVFKDPEIKKLYDKDTMLDSATYTAANNLTPVIKSLKTEQLPAPQRAIVEKIQRELWEEIPEVNISEDRITVTTDKEIQTLEVDGKVYQVDTNDDGTMSVLLSTEKLILDSKRRIESIMSDDSVQESVKPEVKDILSSIIIPQHKVPFEFNKVVWFEYWDYFKLMDTVDNIIGDVVDNHSFIMANKAIKVFDDLMLRNQELKNNTSVHLYEWFTELQKSHKHINKTRRRDLDNDIFESLLKRDYDSYIKTVTKQDEKEYVKDMYNFITTDNPEKQSLRQLYVNMGIRFDSLLDKASKKKNWLNDLINSSIIEDIVNLRHKTEKIAFYEAGIYNPKDFVEEYRKRTIEKWLPYVKQTAEELWDAIFEYDVLAKNMVWKTVGLMRNTSYSVSLWAFSWLSWLAGIAMGTMQIPSEFLRVSAFTKWKYKFTELDDLMSRHKLLQSVGIEPTANFWPFEQKPLITQKVTYDFFRNIAKLAGPDVPDNWFMDRVIKNSAMIISNPLMLTDVVVDPMRKTAALSNVLDTLWYKTIQDFDVALQQMEPSFRKEFLNKVRLASEQKYHEISGWVTAGSYLWKETSLARKKWMMPFNYLMNWTYHIVGTAIGDASMTAKWMRAIMSGDLKNGTRLIKNSNLMNKVFLQGLVAAALYAKIQSNDWYEWEFNTRKDLFEFVRTLNSTMVWFDIFFPTKSIQATIEWEWWIIPKLAKGVGATLQSMFREFDLAGIVMNELQTAHNVPWYDYIDWVITGIVNRGTKWLMYNKSLERESAYPEFVRRALVDQMFGADTPNFDEQLARELNDITSANRIQLLWDEKPWAVIPELLRANNVVRNLTGLMDSKNTFRFYDAQVQELQKTITSPEFQDYYTNPELMIQTLYQSGNLSRVWTNATSWTETYGEIDWLDNNILESELAKYIPEVSKFDKFWQLTEHMIVWELIEQYGKDAYKNLLSDSSEQRRYAQQLMAKISDTTSPAKIPYVISLLLQKEQAEFYKNNPGPSNAQKEAFQALTLAKYSDLIQGSVPLMSQIVSYQALEINPDLKNYLLGSTGFVQQHIADRVAWQIIISNAYQREEFHASYVAGQLGNIMRRTRRAHQDGKINEWAYKTALLDLYTTYDDRIQESNLSPEQKLEIRTALYKALEKDAHVLQESPKLQSEYESARINLIHKLYKFTGDVEKYQREAEWIAAERLSKSVWAGWYSANSFGRAYRNMNQIRQPYGGWGSWNSSWFSSEWLKKSGNQAKWMLQQPGVNFPKVFNPAMNPYARAEQFMPFWFRFTPQQNRFLIEEFRNAMQPQISRDLINNNEPREWARIIRRRKRRAENVESRDRLLWFQNNPWRKSLGLMRDLPGNRQ